MNRKEYYIKKYPGNTELSCESCGVIYFKETYKIKLYPKKYSRKCEKCSKKSQGAGIKKYWASLNKEEKQKYIDKIAKSQNKREMVLKQWQTIKSRPKEEYEEFLRKKSEKGKKAWANRPEEIKKKTLDSMVKAANCGRSKLAKKIKEAMVDNNILGFIEEEYYKGYYPDEINHDIKLIIESYGDIYHCHEKRYPDENEFLPHLNRTVKEQRERDEKRINILKEDGYEILIIWESDWVRDKKSQIDRIKKMVEERKVLFNSN